MIAIRSAAAVILAALLSFPVVAPVAALAEEGSITVKTNMARILRISAPAATVIIGNPGVADVTIQDPQTLVLTGKSFGQTNLIVLDAEGNPIADTLIEVVQSGQTDQLTVYLGGAKTTLSCAPQCQPTIMLGDDAGYTSNVLASSSVVESAAQ